MLEDSSLLPSAATSAPATLEAGQGSRAMKFVPNHDRPRERMQRDGAKALTDAELLAVFFGSGVPGLNVVEMAETLLRKYGGLTQLSRQLPEELQKQHGIGPVKALHLAAVFELGRRAKQEEYRQREITDSRQIYDLLGQEMNCLPTEEVRVVLVNTKMKHLRTMEVHKGTVDNVQAHIRDILRVVLGSEAFAFFLVHNHPSGDATPSLADRSFTRKFHEACRLVDVQFLDHIIIGQAGPNSTSGYFSFRDEHLLL